MKNRKNKIYEKHVDINIPLQYYIQDENESDNYRIV